MILTGKRVLLSYNSLTVEHRLLKKICTELEQRNITHSSLDTVEITQIKDFDQVLIIGGDGTINYTINRLADRDMIFSIIPAGSGNDYFKTLKIKPSEALDIALDGAVQEIYLGVCNGRLFANGCGMGFDGQIAKAFNENRTILKGHAAYYYHVIRTLAGYRPRSVIIKLDGKERKEKIILLTVAKGTTFGGGFMLTPHANLRDGQLAVSLIRQISPLKRFLNIWRLQKGKHDQLTEVSFYKAREIVVECAEDLVAHLDGEVIGLPPWRISLHEKPIKMRVGSDFQHHSFD